MDLPIVVGVDGSEPSLRAVDWAADEAALRGVPLRLVYASLWEQYEHAVFAEAPERTERILTDVLAVAAAEHARQRVPDLRIITEVVPQGPVPVLLGAARDASELVLGSRGHGGPELLSGSVVLAVAAQADCPVVVVRGSHGDRAGPGRQGRVVVGVADKPADPAAVRFAFREAALRAVPLEAVRAWRGPAHDTTDPLRLLGEPASAHRRHAVEALETGLHASAGAYPAVEVRRRTVEGHTRTVLLDASAGCDLLVVGARRPHGPLGPRIGRVTHAVLRHASCPVAVVPERA